MNTRELAVYIKREKVFVTGDEDLIDESIPQNASFMAKRAAKVTKEKKVKEKKAKVPPAEPAIDPAILETKRAQHELDQRKKQLEIDKLAKENAVLGINLDKRSGLLIPTDLVKTLFAQHSKAIIASFHQGVDNLLVEISSRAKFSREEMAALRGKVKEIINDSVDRSVEETQKSLTNMVSEHSDKRNNWERVA